MMTRGLQKRKVNISDLGFVTSGQFLKNHLLDPLFNLKDGTPVYSGDIVEFYVEGEIFQSSGTVQNIDGLKIACFSQILNKWRYWDIIVEDKLKAIKGEDDDKSNDDM